MKEQRAAPAYQRRASGQLLRMVACDDGEARPNRKLCRRLGLIKTKRQKRLARLAARRGAR